MHGETERLKHASNTLPVVRPEIRMSSITKQKSCQRGRTLANVDAAAYNAILEHSDAHEGRVCAHNKSACMH